jgi:hypothetical protein
MVDLDDCCDPVSDSFLEIGAGSAIGAWRASSSSVIGMAWREASMRTHAGSSSVSLR